MDDPITRPEPRRRDFVVTASFAFIGVGCAAAAWPLIAALDPNRGTPRPQVLEVDLSAIAEGSARRFSWRGLPVLVRHRTSAEIAMAAGVPLAELRDDLARNANLPPRAKASAANRMLPGRPQWIVVVDVCTRETCLLDSAEVARSVGDGVGWFCRCCASRYDFAGRAISGPAPRNLEIPLHRIEGRTLFVG